MNLDDLRATFCGFLYLPDPAVVDIVAATAIGNRMDGDRVWMMLVGPPSVGKTEAVDSIADLPEVHRLSMVTPQTFLSGVKQKPDTPPEDDRSLLIRASANGKRMFTFKDFTTVLEMHRESRGAILSQLREIYDGHLTKEVGMGARTIDWTGRFGFLAGVTTAIDAHHAVMNVMGDRFVYFRLPEVKDRRQLARTAALSDDDDNHRAQLRSAMTQFVEDVTTVGAIPPDVPPEVVDRIVDLANFTTWARSAVLRDGYGSRDILVVPAAESPTRFTKQLVTLWTALAAMGHERPMNLVERVSRDSMPRERWMTMEYIAGANGSATVTDLRAVLRLSWGAANRILEDLTALELIRPVGRASAADNAAKLYDMTADGRELWNAASNSREVGTGEGRGEGSKEADISGDRSEVPF